MILKRQLFPETEPCGIWLLLDPDERTPGELALVASKAQEAGVSAILIGGSFIANDGFNDAVKTIKASVTLPVILFPGSSRQLSPHADGILFTSLLSGRNPQYLIAEQVAAAPIICSMKLPSIPTAYLLIESGRMTSTEYVSDTKPLPRNKPQLAVAHAQAAMLFGMQAVYLEAGSGADDPVPGEMIRAVVKNVQIPVIVGGGIRKPEHARIAADAGADAIVIGTAVEEHGSAFLSEIHSAIMEVKP